MTINNLIVLDGCDLITTVLLVNADDIAFGSLFVGVSLSLLIMLIYYMINSNPDPRDFDRKEREKQHYYD